MPRVNCKNPIFYEILVSLRDAEDKEKGKMYWVYHKAVKSIKEYPDVLPTADDALQVKGIGPIIVKALKKGMQSRSSSAGPSNTGTPLAATKKAPGRPRKSDAITDAPTLAAARAASSSFTQPSSSNQASAAMVDGIFEFCYLSFDDNKNEIREAAREKAHFNVDLDPPGYLIEYRRTCQHPIASQILSKKSQPTRMLGYLPMDIADEDEQFSKSTLPLNWLTRPVVVTGSSTSKKASGSGKRFAIDDDGSVDILAAENAKQIKRQKGGGVDPSRQLSTVSNLSWTISASGSGPVTGRSVSLSGGGSGLVQRAQTMPEMPPPSSASHSPVVSSSSQASIRRTDSAPVGNAGRKRAQARPRLSHAIPPPVEMDIDIEDPYASTDHVVFSEFTPLVIPSNHYDVVLLLDNREVKSGVDRSGILDGLRSQNVRVEQRALNVGDVCWIAKRKREYHDGGEYDEIVLDCILERKRLDDLESSIKDGRFHEQKFRLHNAANTRSYYLVEEYKIKGIGISEEHDNFDQSIKTAKSQTADTDKFFVEETRSVNDTIDFYTMLHQCVMSNYQNKDLYIIPSQLVKRYSILKFQKELRKKYPNKPYHISFPIFNSLNSKSGFTTVRETFARMLLCINGVSAEKAGVLVQNFPTMESLYEACKSALAQQKEGDEAERITVASGGKPRKKKEVFVAAEFLQDLGGNTARRIGPALSRRIYNMFMQEEYDDSEDES